jgi:hypothetical protein
MEKQYFDEFMSILSGLIIIIFCVNGVYGTVGSSCPNHNEICVGVADDPTLVVVGSYITVLYSGFVNNTLVDVTIYDKDVGNWRDGYTYIGSASAMFLVIKIADMGGTEHASVRVAQHVENEGVSVGYYPRSFRIIRSLP